MELGEALSAFLEETIRKYNVTLEKQNDVIELKNKENGNNVSIEKEDILSETGEVGFTQYTVRFSTQHRHFIELKRALDYITEILDDEVLPIEFYDDGGRPRFGGDISSDVFKELTASKLSKLFGYPVEYIEQFSYTVKSWSGKNDYDGRQ